MCRAKNEMRTMAVTALCSLMVGLVAGCEEGDILNEDDLYDDVAASTNAIRGGETVSDGGGAVWIDFEQGGQCSGALLNDTTILTAAHCLDDVSNGGDNGVKAWLTRGGNKECISGLNCNNFRSVAVHWDSHYSSEDDFWHDYGVIVVKSGVWHDVSVNDYMYIYADTAAAVRNFDVLGYGNNSYDGTGAGTLRHADRYMNEYEQNQFIDKNIGGAYRICTGDSGSPAVAEPTKFDNAYTNRVLLGTTCGFSAKWPKKAHDTCSKEGNTEIWNRTGSRISNLESWMGKECNATKLRDNGGTDRTVYRCWNSCTGRSAPGVGWKQYGNSGIYLDVNTSECGFEETPLYFTSLGGNSNHWTVRGVTSIYQPSETGFRVYLHRSGITISEASQRKWYVNWEGVYDDVRDDKLCSGQTSSADTDWKQYGSSGIYVDVDTSDCGMTWGNVITSLGGNSEHWSTKGASSVYNVTSNGFRVYVYKSGITVDEAKSRKWHLNWQFNATPFDSPCAGQQYGVWKQYGSSGVYTDVNTTGCQASDNPVVLTSLGGSSEQWSTLGATSIYTPTENGFRVYVNKSGITANHATDWNWHINWKIPAQHQ